MNKKELFQSMWIPLDKRTPKVRANNNAVCLVWNYKLKEISTILEATFSMFPNAVGTAISHWMRITYPNAKAVGKKATLKAMWIPLETRLPPENSPGVLVARLNAPLVEGANWLYTAKVLPATEVIELQQSTKGWGDAMAYHNTHWMKVFPPHDSN